MNAEQQPRPKRSWPKKFRDAFYGVREGVRGQTSFCFHFSTAAAVIVAAVLMGTNLLEWCVLLLCITLVLTAEMFNSALEHMAGTITDRHDPQLGIALDIGSAAVLLASIGASIVGTIILLNRLGVFLGWW